MSQSSLARRLAIGASVAAVTVAFVWPAGGMAAMKRRPHAGIVASALRAKATPDPVILADGVLAEAFRMCMAYIQSVPEAQVLAGHPAWRATANPGPAWYRISGEHLTSLADGPATLTLSDSPNVRDCMVSMAQAPGAAMPRFLDAWMADAPYGLAPVAEPASSVLQRSMVATRLWRNGRFKVAYMLSPPAPTAPTEFISFMRYDGLPAADQAAFLDHVGPSVHPPLTGASVGPFSTRDPALSGGRERVSSGIPQ